MSAFDQGSDHSGREVLRIAEQYGAPEFVKEASSAAIYGESLPRTLYADPLNQAYPVHSPAATWTSYAFFLDKQASGKQDDEVQRRITQAARYWNIEAELHELKKRAAERQKDRTAELPDSDFAIVWKHVDGEVERHLRMTNADEMKRAARWFLRNRDSMSFPDRVKAAGKILAKSASLGETVPEVETFQKCAAIGSGPSKDALDLLYDRAGRVMKQYPGVANQLVKFAEAFESEPALLQDHQQRMKLAAVVDEVDRSCGLQREYVEGLIRPEDVLFPVTPKAAAAFVERHVAVPGGSIYRAAELERLSVQDLEERLGTEFTEKVSADGVFCSAQRLGEVLEKSAAAVVQQFQLAAADLGVEPVALDRPMKLDRAALEKLAASA